jgi:DNA-binding MarR family transcriptional regulator
LQTILTGEQPRRPTTPVDLTDRQLRKRGRYGQAALILDQQALQEDDLLRAAKARQAAQIAKELAVKPVQLEFDFWARNFTMSTNYITTMNDRIKALDVTPAQMNALRAAILLIGTNIRWGTSETAINATELAAELGMKKTHVSVLLDQLEKIGAIYRVKKGRTKIIHVNPEGVYRGKMDPDSHGKAVEQFAKVVDFKPRSA